MWPQPLPSILTLITLFTNLSDVPSYLISVTNSIVKYPAKKYDSLSVTAKKRSDGHKYLLRIQKLSLTAVSLAIGNQLWFWRLRCRSRENERNCEGSRLLSVASVKVADLSTTKSRTGCTFTGSQTGLMHRTITLHGDMFLFKRSKSSHLSKKFLFIFILEQTNKNFLLSFRLWQPKFATEVVAICCAVNSLVLLLIG